MKHLPSKNYFILLFLLHCNWVEAQLPDYYVYLVSGNVTIQKGSAKPQQLKPKQLVYKEDVLTIPESAEAQLVNRDTKFILLNTPGVYKVDELEKKIKIYPPGVTKTYLNLVWDQLLDPHYDINNFKKNNVGGVYGGVPRGQDCDNMIYPVNGLKTSEDTLRFRWLQTSPSNSYTLIIYDKTKKATIKKTVTDTVQLVSFSQDLNGKNGKYYWLINGVNSICEDEEPSWFEFLSKEQEDSLTRLIVPHFSQLNFSDQLLAIYKIEKN
jgi:hypothetical protein